MKRLILLIPAILMLFSSTLMAQERNCATMDVLERIEQENPGVTQQMRQVEQFTQQWVKRNGTRNTDLVTIPIVVHVVYNSSTENISDAQIQSQIDVLNADFRRLNADASNTPTYFEDEAADVEVEFCMASVDPSGNPTDGITRTSTSVTSFSTNDDVKYTSKGGKDAWATGEYLNIWVCDLGGGVLGYAQFPGGGAAETDGVVIGYKYFGTTGTASAPFDKGRTTTHEVGHWLNLRHIWGDAYCGNDYVDDTPTQETSNYNCPSFPSSSCSNYSDMYMNYMDYTDDACMNMFSAGQKSRMKALFASGGFRESLLSSGGCGSGSAAYCASKGSDASYEWIAGVTAGAISNSTGSDGGYADYTAISADMEQEATYDVTLTPGFASSTYNEYWKVWIDYNQDGDFADAGELAFDAGALSSNAVNGSITIPSDATEGETRMRVSMKYDGAQTSCETFSYGEVEDYTVNIVAPAPTEPTYCASKGNDASYEWIAGVAVGALSNSTGSDGGYADYTAISADMEQGGSYGLTLTPGFASSTYNEYWKIWIDYNQDGDFGDAGELAFDAGALSSSAVSGSITIPSDALEGTTRMRVTMKYNGAPGPCETFSYGEVEDYTVNIVAPAPVLVYCDSKGNNSSYEWIDRVTLNTMDYSSGDNGGYADFTSTGTDLQAGTNYTVNLYPGFSGSTYNEYWKIWIDFNQDGDFGDAGELAFDAGGMSNSAINGTVVVPSTAKSGSARMRVTMKYNGAPGSCETFSYGEVEDYTVNITGGTARKTELAGVELKVYPNPAKESAYILLTNEKPAPAELIVYDMRGRKIHGNQWNELNGSLQYELPVHDLNAGVYMITVKTGDKMHHQRLVVVK